MTLQLNVGDEFLGAVFTHEFLVPDVLPDVSSQSFQLLVRLGAPLTSEKTNTSTDQRPENLQ